MTVFGSADDIKRSKIALFHGGDPDAAEYAELTEIAILALPLKCLQRGVVRILCNLATKRYRLLMRNETGASCSSTITWFRHSRLCPSASPSRTPSRTTHLQGADGRCRFSCISRMRSSRHISGASLTWLCGSTLS
jgi:hypothetical protein